MSDPKFPPLMIVPIKHKSLLVMIWEAVDIWVMLGLGVFIGWYLWGMN